MIFGLIDDAALRIDGDGFVHEAAHGGERRGRRAAVERHLEHVSVRLLTGVTGTFVPAGSPGATVVSSHVSQVPQGVGPPAQFLMRPGQARRTP